MFSPQRSENDRLSFLVGSEKSEHQAPPDGEVQGVSNAENFPQASIIVPTVDFWQPLEICE